MRDRKTNEPAVCSLVGRETGRLVGERCGILHDGDVIAPGDPEGCLLPIDHEGPHEYVSDDGTRWLWETDVECDCEHCMRCDGDYCTVYWRKPTNGQGKRETTR